MKRTLVLCALEAIALSGCSRQGGEVLQLLPSPNGAYRAVALVCPKGANERSTVLKVVRAGDPTTCEAPSLQEETLTSSDPPRMAWMSNSLLVIDSRGAPTDRILLGEVSFAFAPWQVSAPSLDLSNIAGDPSARPTADAGEQPSKVPPVESVCRFPGLTLPSDFSVLAGGAYAGKESSVHIDQSGNTATTMTVLVDNPQKPVVLMLGAYEPTIWTIKRAAGTTLLAVLASGYHRQVVTGLDATTPVAIHTADNRSPCGFFYVDKRNLEKLNPMAQRFFGRDVDKVYPAYNGVLTLSESPAPLSPWVGRGDAPVESYIEKTVPPSPEEELDEALRKGQLRRATLGDKKQWEAEMARVAPSRGLSPTEVQMRSLRANSSGTLDRAYVVLKPMTFPSRLYGSRSVVFFIPKGVERPRGNPGHSSVYDFNDMTCTGVGCM
ncbi:hypothetical protein F0U61_53930 [Archangium violaceum]|uniref:hypothetical protein n=1 Tax=Archangium violaceum TaxID=83451 RepID=UPI002B315FA7|nr:hypothetical protein F0U61_53930 [Archangium violaceum]